MILLRKRYLYLPLTIILSYLLSITTSSCEKATIILGSDFSPNTPTTLAFVDTSTVHISTVYVDSFITSEPSALLIGNYIDPLFGAISCRSFMQFGLPATPTMIPIGSVYDSTEIIVRFNKKYFYGDSTKPFTVRVNQLAAPITLQPSQPFFYNIDSCLYNPATAVLGSTTIYSLRPSVLDSISINLNGDSTGRDLFNKFVTGAPEIINEANFLNYFKGVAISGSSSNGMIGGFSDTVEMRLHYRAPGGSQYTYVSFNIYSPVTQFNNITVNRTGTAIAGLNSVTKELPSSATNNAGYDQFLTGSMVKLSFPYLRNLLLLPNFVKIVKAVLLIKPVPRTYQGIYVLPPQLQLAQTNSTNTIGAYLPGNPTGDLFIDYLNGTGTAYSYDITGYLQNLIAIPDNSDNAINGYGLLALAPTPTNVVNRIAIGDIQQTQNYSTQVQIYYAAVQ